MTVSHEFPDSIDTPPRDSEWGAGVDPSTWDIADHTDCTQPVSSNEANPATEDNVMTASGLSTPRWQVEQTGWEWRQHRMTPF